MRYSVNNDELNEWIACGELSQVDRKEGILVGFFSSRITDTPLSRAWEKQELQDSQTEFSTDDKSGMHRI